MQTTVTRYQYFFLTILIMLTIFLLGIASNQFFITYITSDYLYIYETSKNLISTKTLAGQNFPAAPYFFPDLLVSGLFSFFSDNITVLHFAYSLLFLLVFIVLVYRLIRLTCPSLYLSLLGAGFSTWIIFSIIPIGITFIRDWPASHLSVLLFSLFLLHYYIKSEIGIGKWIGMFILTYLIFISDNLIVIQAMAPLSILMFIDIFFKKTNKKFNYSLLGLFIFVVLLGCKISDFLTYYFDASFSLNVSLFRLRKMNVFTEVFMHAMQVYRTHMRGAPVFYGMLFLYNIAAIVLFFLVKNRFSHYTHQNLVKIIGFLYLAQVTNIMMAILVGKFTEMAHLRYVDTIYIFPGIALSVVLVNMLHMKFYKIFVKLLISILILSGLYSYIYNNYFLVKPFSLDKPYNLSVQCIDALQSHYHIKNGLADFWNVRAVRMLSKNNIHISQVNNDLNFSNLADNKIYFYSDVNKKLAYEYQFIIVNNLSKDKVKYEVGKPNTMVLCGDRELWLYTQKNSRDRLNNFFAKKLIDFI